MTNRKVERCAPPRLCITSTSSSISTWSNMKAGMHRRTLSHCFAAACAVPDVGIAHYLMAKLVCCLFGSLYGQKSSLSLAFRSPYELWSKVSLGDLSVYSNNNIYPFLQSNDVFPARFAIVLLDGRGYVNKGISVFSEEKSDTGSRTTGVQGKRDVIYDKRIR